MTRIIAFGVAVAAIVAGVYLGQERESDDARAEAQAALPAEAAPRSPAVASDQTATANPTLDVSTYRVKSPAISSPAQREGESADFHKGRLLALQMWDSFLSDAKLTADQEREVLRILGDAQIEYALTLVAEDGERKHAVEASKVDRSQVGEDVEAFENNVRARLASVLEPEQMEAFHLTIALAYGWLGFFPLDVPVPGSHGQGRIAQLDGSGT